MSYSKLHKTMFHTPKAPYTICNQATTFTYHQCNRLYILLHIVPTIFAKPPPRDTIYVNASNNTPSTLTLVCT